MTQSTLTGGCGCGVVRFAVLEPPVLASYCHCTRCQRRTGGGSSLQARLAPGSFTLTEGEEHVAVWAPTGGFEKCFCRLCGSALFSRNPSDPTTVSVRFGAFDDDPGIRPSFHQFVAYAPAWDTIPDDGLPRFPEAKPPDAG
jgi:hypothetical protein